MHNGPFLLYESSMGGLMIASRWTGRYDSWSTGQTRYSLQHQQNLLPWMVKDIDNKQWVHFSCSPPFEVLFCKDKLPTNLSLRSVCLKIKKLCWIKKTRKDNLERLFHDSIFSWKTEIWRCCICNSIDIFIWIIFIKGNFYYDWSGRLFIPQCG